MSQDAIDLYRDARKKILDDFREWIAEQAGTILQWWMEQVDEIGETPSAEEVDEQIDAAMQTCYWTTHTEVAQLLATALLLESGGHMVWKDAPEHLRDSSEIRDPKEYLIFLVDWRLRTEMRDETHRRIQDEADARDEEPYAETPPDPCIH